MFSKYLVIFCFLFLDSQEWKLCLQIGEFCSYIWGIKCCLPFQETSDVTVISDCSPPMVISWAQRELRKEIKNTYHQTPEGESWNNSGCADTDSWGACPKNDFCEPRLLHLPIHRKVLNSLRYLVVFFFKLTVIFYSYYLPFIAKFLYILATSLSSSEQFL